MKVIEFTIPVVSNNLVHIQEDRLSHFYDRLHRHNETQLTWVLKGEGTLIVGNAMHPFKDDDVFIIGANQPHLFKNNKEFFEVNSTKYVHSINIYFNPAGTLSKMLEFPDMEGIKRFINKSTRGVQFSASNHQNIAKSINKICDTNYGFRMAAFIELLQLLSDLKHITPLISNTIGHPTDSEGIRMDEIYQFTINNFTRDISLAEIAAVVYLTPQSFCRYFKKHTRKTYTAFLNELRINEACKVFTSHNFTSISAVAYQVGFNNVVNFNRVFKNIKGKCPGEFIKFYNGHINYTE